MGERTDGGPNILLLCATARGLRMLEELAVLARGAGATLTVISFREEPWEPPFLEAIRAAAERHGARFAEGRSVDAHVDADLLLAVSWRYIVPPSVYSRPRLGAYLFHDSYLPELRGFAPTVWAMINGESSTGVTLLRMAEGVDEGDIVEQRRVPIGDDDTIAEVMERVTGTYVDLLRANFSALLRGSVAATPQDHSRATYGCRRLPSDARIDWRASSRTILNLIRASTFPYPGAFTTLDGKRLTIWSASPPPPDQRRYAGRVPGRVIGRIGNGVGVLTGDGTVVVTEVQIEGGQRAPAGEILTSLSITLE